jgi:hypothetical protein
MNEQSRHTNRLDSLRPGRLIAVIAVLGILAPVAVTASSRLVADAASTVVNGTRFVAASYSVSQNPPQFTIRSSQILLDAKPGDYAAATVFDQYPTVYSDMAFTLATNASPSLGTQDAFALARWTGNSSYSVRLRFRSDGSLALRVMRTVHGRTQAISPQTLVRGVRWSPSTAVRVRITLKGRWPTTVRAKAWLAGTSEPSRWTLAVRDRSAALQTSGALGLAAQTSTAGKNSADTAVSYTYRNVRAKGRGKSTGDPNPAPTPTPTTTPTPTATPRSTPTPTPPPTSSPVTPVGDCPQSLANAISGTPAGGTLDVRGCTYTGQFTISRSMTLLGGTIVGKLSLKASDVTVNGLDIYGGTAAAQTGQIDSSGYDRIVVANVHSHNGTGAGVSIQHSKGSQVLNSEFDHMTQEGYHFYDTTNLVVSGSSFHDNNYNNDYDPGWEAGGGKMAQSYNALFENNQSWNNHGPGFWDDVYNQNTVFRGNRAWGNTRAGIMEEIGYGALIANNVLWNNYAGQSRTWVMSASILVHSSTDVIVRGNIVYDTDIGIGIDHQNRGIVPQNISVVGNYVVECNALVAWGDDTSGNALFNPGNHNGGSGNSYWKSAPEPTYNRFAWGNGWQSTLAAFEATGAEQGSVYLSHSQADSILAGAGIPLP